MAPLTTYVSWGPCVVIAPHATGARKRIKESGLTFREHYYNSDFIDLGTIVLLK